MIGTRDDKVPTLIRVTDASNDGISESCEPENNEESYLNSKRITKIIDTES